VEISLDKNDSVLITKRLQKQALVIYFSNLAGSILGVLGAIGFTLNLFEKNYEKYIKNRKIVMTLKQLIRAKYSLSEKNFATLPPVAIHPEPRFDSLEYFNITMNEMKFSDNLQGSTTYRGI
jgi:hypothetical protein